MKVEALMSRTVVTVRPDTPLREVAALLVSRRIAGVPVCAADGSLVGVVSEGDILWKETGESPEPHGVLARLLELADDSESRFAATTAGEAMTAPAISIAPQASVATAARLMIEHRINRLPVVSDGSVVGIVARSDLVRAFARPDAEIAREITDEVVTHGMWIDPSTLDITVEAGVVTVAGRVDTEAIARALERRIRGVPGVVRLQSRVDWVEPPRQRRALSELYPTL